MGQTCGVLRVTAVAGCVAAALTLSSSISPAAAAGPGHDDRPHGRSSYTFAVIGDIPYGDAQIASFPQVIKQINAAPAVQLVDHLGDIKSASSVCSDAYFRQVKSQFDKFTDPLVYTIGDNEWTDCHRPNNGAYNPLERLTKIRSLFFPHPGQTLGQHPAPLRAKRRRATRRMSRTPAAR